MNLESRDGLGEGLSEWEGDHKAGMITAEHVWVSLNKAGVFPSFAAFSLFLLRLEGSYGVK